MDKREKENLRKQEDAALVHFLAWLLGTAVLSVILLAAKRYRVNFRVDELDLAEGIVGASGVVAIVAAIAAVAAVVWAVVSHRSGKKLVYPVGTALFLAGLTLDALVIRKDNDGTMISGLLAVYAVWAALALVYYFYQRDFFAVALTGAEGILWVWFYSRLGRSTASYVLLVLEVLILAGVAVVAYEARKNKGALRLGSRTVQLFPPKANYGLIYLSCVLMLVVLVASLLLVGGGIPTGVFYAVPVAWLFIMAVYYTVKLM